MNIHIKSHELRIKSREKSPWPDIDPPVEDPRLQALRCSNPLVHRRGNFSGGQPSYSRNNQGTRPGINYHILISHNYVMYYN